MANPLFLKRSDNAADRAFLQGKRPGDLNQLGPTSPAITDPKAFANAFVRQRFNPDITSLKNSRFSDETAAASQNKIDMASKTAYSSFTDPTVKATADRFLDAYTGAVQRGIIPQDEAVFPENLNYLVSQDATARIARKDQNVKGDFPSQGVSV